MKKTMRSYQRPPRRSTRQNGVNPSYAAVFTVLALLSTVILSAAQQPRGVVRGDARFSVLGSDSCRTCHRALFEDWQQSPHALAAATLTAAQSADPECTACHIPDADAFEPAVGCEACHGPGSAYAELDNMIDAFKSRAAGLLEAGETCASCHNPGHDFHVERDLRAAARAIHPR